MAQQTNQFLGAILCKNLLPLNPVTTPVILFDLWKTLARGPYPEPIEDLQHLLNYQPKADRHANQWQIQGVCRTAVIRESGGKALCIAHPQTQTKLDCEFLRVCLTIPEQDPKKFVYKVAERFDLDVPDGVVDEFAAKVQSEMLGLCYFGDVHRELRKAQKLGFRIGLLSNVWSFPVETVLSNIEGEDANDKIFEHVVTSSEVGVAKPEPGIFLEAVRRFKLKPEQCVMVGDNPDLDVRGALNVGMKAVHIDRYGDCTDFVSDVPVIRQLAKLTQG